MVEFGEEMEWEGAELTTRWLLWREKHNGETTTTTTTPPSVIPLTRGVGRSECRQSYPCKYHYSQIDRFQ